MFDVIGLIKALLGFGETIKSVSSDIARVKVAAREAETNEKRIDAEGEAKALELRRDVLIGEAPGSRVNQLVRVVLSIPAIVFLWKVVIWDICLGWGSTDNPSQNVWVYILAVVGFYLLNRTIQVARR